ncbi:UgpE ABC-type sugar transport system, permease component [Candidatus Nanopelagicaceae bacterium]
MSTILSKSQIKRNESLMERSGSFSNPFEKKSKMAKFRRLPIYLLTFVMIAPYYWMITSSFKSVKELQVVPPTLWPKKWITGNYYDPNFDPLNYKQDVMQGLFQRYPDLKFGFFRFIINSVVVNISITVLTLFVGSLAAYVVSKHRFKGKKAVYLVIIGSMMIPWQVGLIPGFLLMDTFGWLNTFWAYIVPALPKAFIVFFLTQYLTSIPDELVEAARIDGASEFTIYLRIILPLLKPALIAMMIFTAIGEWNNFLWPLIITTSQDMATLPVALANLKNAGAGNIGTQGVIMAASLITSIPTIALYFATQKHFIRGIALSGLK